MSGILYIISAPSGSGKSTLVNELRKFVPNLEFSISYTTRLPRGSEQNAREYHFVAREAFEGMIARNEFLEYALVFGNYYGTAKHVFEQAAQRGNDVLLDIDVQGERQVKRAMPGAVSIFVLPPSRAELESRLRKRSLSENVHSEEIIQRRLHRARKEIENYPNYDYILVNDHLEESVDRLQAVVLGERLGRAGRPLSVEEVPYVETARTCLKENMEDKIRSILASFDVSLPKT
ncbi:MAG TPA: guanylate kinase [Candidatus Saccharimonadales bacterium]|nr:guanylate kinase [Candidatus Saccharimonadales bacterium]